MRISYSMNAAFFQLVGLPRDIRALLKALYKASQNHSRLTDAEHKAIKDFVASYPETVKEAFRKEEK